MLGAQAEFPETLVAPVKSLAFPKFSSLIACRLQSFRTRLQISQTIQKRKSKTYPQWRPPYPPLKLQSCPRVMLVLTASQTRSSANFSSVAFNSTSSALVSQTTRMMFEGSLLKRVNLGQTGLGKSTLINTIFASHLIDSKGRLSPTEPVRSTTEIQSASHGWFTC